MFKKVIPKIVHVATCELKKKKLIEVVFPQKVLRSLVKSQLRLDDNAMWAFQCCLLNFSKLYPSANVDSRECEITSRIKSVAK